MTTKTLCWLLKHHTMQNRKNDITIVIYAESPLDRDFYRNSVLGRFAKVFCFEKELTCFDNLETIRPDVIILKTESCPIVWRFVFAVRAFNLNSLILVASETLNVGLSLIEELGLVSNPGVDNFNSIEELFTILDHYPDHSDKQRKTRFYHDALFVGGDPQIKNIRTLLPTLISSDDPVLITGEPGVGKEALVRHIVAGLGPDAIFIKMDCAELQPDMIAGKDLTRAPNNPHSPMFNQSGESKEGPLVVYLDGIDKLEQADQSKLLLFFDDPAKAIFGKKATRTEKIRFIGTADQALIQLLCCGRFRKDLYYRLNVIPISIPPLRERRGDIPVLIDYFIIIACAKSRTSLMALSLEAQKRLILYDWPENLKELQAIIERIVHTRNESVVLQEGLFPVPAIKGDELLRYVMGMKAIPDAGEIKNSINATKNLSLKTICHKFASRTEKKLMQKALETTNWNRKKAAALLNISYKSMLNKMKMYEIA